MSILKEIYDSDFIHVMEPDTEEWRKTWAEQEAQWKQLQELLTEEQFRLIDGYLRLENALAQMYQTEIFCQGVKLGARLYQEITGPDRMQIL